MLPWILLFVVPLGIANLMLPAVIFATQRFSLLDDPDPGARKESTRIKKIHTIPTPRIGGLAIVVSFFAALPFLDVPMSILKVYAGGIAMFLLGFVDDFKPIPAKFKLIIQIIIAAATIYAAGLGITNLNFLGLSVPLDPAIGLMFSSILVVGTLNSINMIDGMDGLAAGVALIGIAMLTYLHFFVTKEFWLIRFFALILTGSVLGFLKFNTYPAKIFMGDGGSHWLGFMCGILAVIVFGGFSPGGQRFEAHASNISIPLLSVVMCLAVPMVDTITLIIYRLKDGRHPFSADHSHFHHSLQKIGLSDQQSVLLIYFVSFAFAFIGFSPLLYPSYSIELLPVAFFVALLSVFYYLKVADTGSSQLSKFMDYRFRAKKGNPNSLVYKFSRIWANVNRYIVYGILFVSPVLANSVSDRLALVNLVLAGLIGITGFFRVQKSDFYFHSLLAISICSILVSVNQTNLTVHFLGEPYEFQYIYNSAFIFLIVSSSLYFLATLNRYKLTVTPTDFLLLGIPLLLVLAPEPYNSRYLLDIISARTLVLFFVIRTFVVGYSSSMRKVRIVVLFSLLNLALSP